MVDKKIQLFYIHGGMTFKNRSDYLEWLKTRDVSLESHTSWSNGYLQMELEDLCEVIKPRMPLADDAHYEDWKIVFERYLELLDDEIILMGTSLGGIFLAKYLSENKIDKKLIAVYMIAAPFDDSITGEDLVGGFELGDELSLIESQCDKVRLLFSKDDDCVPVSHADKFGEKLPNSKIVILENKNGHFVIDEFPEIIELIKNDIDANISK